MLLSKNVTGYVMIMPALFIVLLFVYWPSFTAGYYSFTDWKGGSEAHFVGLSNYLEVFKDSALRKGFANIAVIFVFSLVTLTSVATLIAVLIYHIGPRKWSRFYQVIFVLPLMVPAVVGIYVGVQVIMDAQYGLLNSILSHFTENTPNWFGDKQLALYSLLIMGFPFVHGIFILMILAGLQSISPSINEAAKLEGITAGKRFWLIELPLIKPQLKTVVGLMIIWVLQTIGPQIVFTQGGPGYSTTTPSYELYKNALSYNQFGYSNAIGVVLFAMILLGSLINLRRKDKE